MTTQPQHTPTPWVLEMRGRDIIEHIYDANGNTLFGAHHPHYEENETSQLIVRAVNSHDALVAALGEMTIWASKDAPEAIINNALAVLKLAKGEKP